MMQLARLFVRAAKGWPVADVAKVAEADAQRKADKAECVEGSFLFLIGKPLSECTTPMQKRGWAMAQVEQRKNLRFQENTGE